MALTFKMAAFTAENFMVLLDACLRPNWQNNCPNLLMIHTKLTLIGTGSWLELRDSESASWRNRLNALLELTSNAKTINAKTYREYLNTSDPIARMNNYEKAQSMQKWLIYPDDPSMIISPTSSLYIYFSSYLEELLFEYLPALRDGRIISSTAHWKKLKMHLESPSLKRIFKGKGRVMDAPYWKEKEKDWGQNIEYLNEEERKEKEVFVRAGTTALRVGARLVDRLGNLFDTKSMETAEKGAGWGAFVISADQNRLYVNSHIRLKFHHSSFLSGARVHSAGEISVDSGKITHMCPKSGHYKPTLEMLYYFLHWLIYRGYNLRDTLVQPDITDDCWCDALYVFYTLKSMSSEQRAAL